MRIDFHQHQTTLIALAVGGLIALGKDVAGAVAVLLAYAQTPKGLAAMTVASFLTSVACLAVTMVKRS